MKAIIKSTVVPFNLLYLVNQVEILRTINRLAKKGRSETCQKLAAFHILESGLLGYDCEAVYKPYFLQRLASVIRHTTSP